MECNTITTNSPIKHLPLEFPYLTHELKEKAKKELFEDEETRINSLKLIRSMMKEESKLTFMDEDYFLLAFLRSRKFDVKKAFNLMKKLYITVTKHPEIFENFEDSDILRTLNSINSGLLMQRDVDNCIVLLVRAQFWNPKEVSVPDYLRCICAALVDTLHYPATQITGIKLIIDMKNATINQVTHLTPKYLFLIAESIQNILPLRFKQIHILNEGYLFSTIYAIVRKFLSKKITDRIHFHGKNVTKLHKYISPDILPQEYGGKQPKYDNTEWAATVMDSLDSFHYILSFCFAKSKERK